MVAILGQIDINQKVKGVPLICALCQTNLELDLILPADQKIDFLVDDEGKSPLHYAAQVDDLPALGWCLKRWTLKEHAALDKNGFSAFDVAVQFGANKCFLLLLRENLYDERGVFLMAELNKSWQLTVMHTTRYNIFEIRNQNNMNILEVALHNNSSDVCRFLAEHYTKQQIKTANKTIES